MTSPIPPPTRANSKSPRKIHIALSIDFDAVSGFIGTGFSPANTLSDYSAGHFAGKVGSLRLLKLLQKLNLADKVTWFIPGHSMQSFAKEVDQVIESGAEVALHGYCHESAYKLSEQQERDIFEKCIELATTLCGKRPVGYRAPLYQIRESTVALLEDLEFEYDASLSHHDSRLYWLPHSAPITPIDYSKPAGSWMHPLAPSTPSKVVELPANWYTEDMTPLSFFPHVPNSQGYVDVRVIEQMWKDKFEWLWENETDDGGMVVFPIILHPDTSGMAHVAGMVERFLGWLVAKGDGVQFATCRDIAAAWKVMQES